MNQNEVAKKAEITGSMLSQILSGYKRPKWETAKRLAKVTGTKPELWLDGTPEEIKIVLDNIA